MAIDEDRFDRENRVAVPGRVIQFTGSARRPSLDLDPLDNENVGKPSDREVSFNYAVPDMGTFLPNIDYGNDGTLTVTITPSGAVTSGAQWSIDGGSNYNDSGVSLTLAAGDYTVSYKPISGWATPSSEIAQVENNQTVNVAAVYVALPFILSFKTDNSGSSNNDQFTLQLRSGLTYDFEWQTTDGTSGTHNTDSDLVLTLPSGAGTYDIEILGVFPQIYNNNTGDAQKVVDVTQWGSIQWDSFEAAFFGCFNLNAVTSASDAPILDNVTVFKQAFMFCIGAGFDEFPTDWDLSDIEDFESAWEGTTNMLTGFESYDLTSAITLERAWYQYVDKSAIKNWNCTTSLALTSIRETWFKCDLEDCGGTGISIFPFFEMGNVVDAAAPWVITNLKNINAGLNFSNVEDIQGLVFGGGFLGFLGEIFPAFDYRKVTNGLAAFQSAPNIVLAAAPQFHALTDGTDMFLNGTATLTQSQYESVLIDMEANNPNDNVTFNAQGSVYASGSAAETAKTALQARGWTFIDGGSV